MIASFVLVGVLCATGAQSMMSSVGSELMAKVHNFNLCAQCWGEEFAFEYKKSIMEAVQKCGGAPEAMALSGNSVIGFPAALMAKVMPAAAMPLYSYNTYPGYQHNMFAYGRKKRDVVSDYAIDASDVEEFHQDMETMVGNFTCVMKEMGFLTEAGEINPMMTQGHSGMFTSGNKAGSDPVFVQKLATEMSDCATISRNFPQQALNRNPFMQKYGRMAIFFKCIKKAERDCCAKYMMCSWMEKMGMEVDATGFADKYDAACMAAKIMKHSATPEAKHVDDYFFGELDM